MMIPLHLIYGSDSIECYFIYFIVKILFMIVILFISLLTSYLFIAVILFINHEDLIVVI